MTRIMSMLSVCGVCVGASLGGPDPVAVMAEEIGHEEALRIAPIIEYTSPWQFRIGEWIDLNGPQLPAEDPMLQWYFDLGQRNIVGGGSVAGCQDNSGVTGRYLYTADSGARYYNNIIAQNDFEVAPGSEGLNTEFTSHSYARQADDFFLYAITYFDSWQDNTGCSDPATGFLGGFVVDFGFRTGDINGPADGHQAFFFNTQTPAANGINIPAPADGKGTYIVAYGNFYDQGTGVLTPHPGAQPGHWCTSQFGGLADRPGVSHELATVDDEDGVLSPTAECTDSTSGTRLCAMVIEPMLSAGATYDADACVCLANLTPSECATNTNDFFAFLALYQAQDPQADFSPGGGINTNDFFAYLAAYQADLNNPDCPG